MTEKKLWEDACRWKETFGCKVATSETEEEERGKKGIGSRKFLSI